MIPSNRRRVLVMPLIVLMVGCAVAWWSSMRLAEEREAVRGSVTRLVQDICNGTPVWLPIDPTAGAIGDLLVRELRRACAEAGSGSAIEVVVSVGDSPDAGRATGTATHTALIRERDSGRVMLVLRVNHGDRGAITIAGYLLPPSP
jgi:hypothetical protein